MYENVRKKYWNIVEVFSENIIRINSNSLYNKVILILFHGRRNTAIVMVQITYAILLPKIISKYYRWSEPYWYLFNDLFVQTIHTGVSTIIMVNSSYYGKWIV